MLLCQRPQRREAFTLQQQQQKQQQEHKHMVSPKTDQEARLEVVFAGLEADFKRLDKARGADKAAALLKGVTAKLKDAKV